MFNPLAWEKYAKARQEELWRWAEQERLLREAQQASKGQQGAWYRALWSLGQLMIWAGCWLQARQRPIL